MPDAIEYTRRNSDRFLVELEELVRIPSVSTDPEYETHVLQAATYLANDMRRIGLSAVDVFPTDGHPVVYGEYETQNPSAPTVLLYAHYDVQPAFVDDGWDTDPFQPVRKDGKLFGRGTSDDKIHTTMILKAIESFSRSDESCPVNLKVVFEGDEERGSVGFMDWVRENPDKLKADYCLVYDGGIDGPEKPSLTYGRRGIVALDVAVRGPKTDLHSGTHGGRVHNPAQAIAEIIARLHDENGRVTVPGFYDNVVVLDEDERRRTTAQPFSEDMFEEYIGAPEPWGESEYTLEERSTIRPTLEINGIFGGYSDEGLKTVIPSLAGAKITCRLVDNQKPREIYEKIADYLESIAPSTVRLETTYLGGGDPVVVPIDNHLVQTLTKAFRNRWETPVVYRRVGGSVPILAVFQNELAIPSISLGFALPGARAHGVNENIDIDMFYKGIDMLICFLREIVQD